MSWLWSIWLKDGLVERGCAPDERRTGSAVAKTAVPKRQAAPPLAGAAVGGGHRGLVRVGALAPDVRHGILRICIERLVSGLRLGA